MVLLVGEGLASLLIKERQKLWHNFFRNTDMTDRKDSISIKKLPGDPREKE